MLSGQTSGLLRSERGLSQEKLALLSELDDMQIYRIENGKVKTTISTILALAKALQVSPKELLNFEFKTE